MLFFRLEPVANFLSKACFSDRPAEQRFKLGGDSRTIDASRLFRLHRAHLALNELTLNRVAGGQLVVTGLQGAQFRFDAEELPDEVFQIRADFDQQPLEAAMMVLACREAVAVTGDSAWMELAHHAARWFVGQNALGVSMVDEDTGGCHDGLEEDGVNPNQGAESSLAWLMAAYALQRRPAFTSAAR